ncbi:hypothetical protein C4577_05925 [Candidatus Parcubacteria bacterium]|nr:MAG: hypothetical protein C4577_05925 [Candidatus Parcubacteria bacterium]
MCIGSEGSLDMSFLILLSIRIACLVAIGMAWGWWIAIVALLSLVFIGIPKYEWGSINMNSLMVWPRLIVEISVTFFGLIAANVVWGAIWAATLLIICVIGFVIKD